MKPFRGELPLRGAAQYREEGRSFWGSTRCAGLLNRGRENALSGAAAAARGCREEPVYVGPPAARGCLMGGGTRLQMGELPLRGAARCKEG